MGWSLLPREEKFFTLFERMAAKVVEGANRFRDLVENYTDVAETPQNLNIFLVEINRLENQADVICREQLAKLFKSEPDVRELLKWKEIYEQLEACADRCEDVADIIEDIVVKNA